MSDDAYLDHDGYPTNAAIRRLETWGDPEARNGTSEYDVNGAIDFMRSLWWLPKWGISDNIPAIERNVYCLDDVHRYVMMSTGGWSGNEELMQAFRSRWWRAHSIVVTRRGGHYVLEYARGRA